MIGGGARIRTLEGVSQQIDRVLKQAKSLAFFVTRGKSVVFFVAIRGRKWAEPKAEAILHFPFRFAAMARILSFSSLTCFCRITCPFPAPTVSDFRKPFADFAVVSIS